MTSKPVSTLVTSVTYNQAPVSPLFHHTVSSLEKRTAQLAQARLESFMSEPKATPLSDSEDKAYDFVAKLSEAYQCLETEENKEALELFQEINALALSANLDKDSLIRVHCDLGIAYADASLRDICVADATDVIRNVEVNNQGWYDLEQKQKSKFFLELLSCYKLLLPLIPPAQTDQRQILNGKIDALNFHLLREDYLDELVREADRCVERKEPEKARELYQKALQWTLPPPFGTIRHAWCEINCALTYRSNSTLQKRHIQNATQLLNQLFDERGENAKTLRWSQEKFAETLVSLFTALLRVRPGDTDIQKKLETCRSELPQSAIKETTSTHNKSVTRQFPGSPTTTRIFFVGIMTILSFALIGTLTLLQRNVKSVR
ncbi:MAG TPA: hypothetical protein VFU89_02075 [Rhabdochlamydiaceae bacterium]|nr:hypothetical protein [Rhabdochlamydiaceae bacterium]